MRSAFTRILLAIGLILVPMGRPAQAQAGYRLTLPVVLRSGSDYFGPIHSGDGTYYYATGDGACMFGPSPSKMMVAAMNHVDYGTADLCGAYVRATGPKGSVLVRIVDLCPECPAGDIDFSQEAFAVIAELPQGRVPITWQLASPPIAGPVAYVIKDGSNQWWTAVQVRNHRNPIAALEYKNGSGTFVNVPRMSYNYFVQASGMGPGPYTFRITDVFGNVLIDSNIPLAPDVVTPGVGQFPQAP